MYQIKSSHHIIDRKAQITTTARVNALKDGRVTYLTACLLEGEDILCFLCYFPNRDVAYPAFSGHLPGHRKWNADATTIEVKKNQSGELSSLHFV